ncbi:MAG: GNAT family N-acetyltransferase [Firmicutes bacterium]|nr:GNAT family N-acetyltransferase [Bacillota bacterium]
MENVQIRKTRQSDIEQNILLGAKVQTSAFSHIFPREIIDLINDPENIKKKIEQTQNEDLNKNGNVNFVAVVGARVVAFANATITSGYEHYKKLGYADLWSIYIDPEFQHLGVGKKLFDMVVVELGKLGATKMIIGVLRDNVKARAAYEKWGGKLDTEYETFYEKFGHKFPEIFYTVNI